MCSLRERTGNASLAKNDAMIPQSMYRMGTLLDDDGAARELGREGCLTALELGACAAFEANDIVGVGARLPFGRTAQRVAVQAHLALRVVASLGLVAEGLVDLDVTRDAVGDDRREGRFEALSVVTPPVRSVAFGAIRRNPNT